MADRRYWDSTVFFAYLADQEGRAEKCEPIIRRAEEGEIEIVTSALTYAEVCWLPQYGRMDRRNRPEIRGFFEHPYIVTVQIDRRHALQAQDLVLDHGLRPRDALHVAAALVAQVDIIDTFDGDQLELDGSIEGSPPLRIAEPHVPPRLEDVQEEIFQKKVESE